MQLQLIVRIIRCGKRTLGFLAILSNGIFQNVRFETVRRRVGWTRSSIHLSTDFYKHVAPPELRVHLSTDFYKHVAPPELDSFINQFCKHAAPSELDSFQKQNSTLGRFR
jgi:hypothetical protein